MQVEETIEVRGSIMQVNDLLNFYKRFSDLVGNHNVCLP